jgi:RNA polymerase sigma-54 factor
MKPSLQVRLSQHLALTPQWQQSIRLLQLSTLELHQEVQQMLDQNPFLEPEDDAGLEPLAPERSAQAEAQARVQDSEASSDGFEGEDGSGSSSAEMSGGEFGTTEREDWANGTEGDDFDGIRETPVSGASGEGEGDSQDQRPVPRSLQEHLRLQVTGMRLSEHEAVALEVLFDSLDGDGYLADALEDIAERLVEMQGLAGAAAREAQDTWLEHLQVALRCLQSLEPTGVGARNLSECLVLQLRLLPKRPVRQLAIRIAEQHLDTLARRDVRRLASLTGADEEDLRAAQALIVACEPKPARPFADAESNIIVPDVVVTRSGRGLRVALNPDVMPKLRINDLYAQMLRGQRAAGLNGAHAGLSTRLQEARWFVKNIQQRFDTILRVSKAIVERQKNFFAHGAIAMKPLVLREIADELNLHESTISRVTTAKYMATPMGTFELKYFFGSSLNTEAGGAASSTAVRALIGQFVDAEDQLKPLSDSQLSDMLAEQGITVARRTVAKYREALRIAPASQRRAL